MAEPQTSTEKSTPAPRRRSKAPPSLPGVTEMGAASALGVSGKMARLAPAERKALFDEIGKDLANVLGADLVAQMLAETRLSQRAIDAETGYNHSALSRMARGETKSGPTLWKLFALAEALGFKLELKLSRK